jgi:hypothetical protein
MRDAVIRETKTACSLLWPKPSGDLVDTPGKITVDGAPINRVEDSNYLGDTERCKAAL